PTRRSSDLIGHASQHTRCSKLCSSKTGSVCGLPLRFRLFLQLRPKGVFRGVYRCTCGDGVGVCPIELLQKNAVEGDPGVVDRGFRSEEHTSALQSRFDLVCRLLLDTKK